MTFHLKVHFLDDSASYYEYSASVQTSSFSGCTDAAELWQSDLRTFAARLRGYPLSAGNPPALITAANWDGLPREEILRVEIYPADSTGTLRVRVCITDVSEGKPHHRLQRIAPSFETDYSMLARFADAIDCILRDGGGEAQLDKKK